MRELNGESILLQAFAELMKIPNNTLNESKKIAINS
jgi:hypothetical protein